MNQSNRWTLLHTQLHRVLRQRQLLPKCSKVLLAFSGGQDSFCLLRLLIDLQPKWEWELALVHGDHRWPADTAENAKHVVRIAHQYQLSLFARRAPTVLKTEEAGRRWRYQILTEIAQEQDYTRVVTAHTASDRAETLLYNLIRGSGTDGLQALSWQRPLSAQVQLVRPLLDITRTQTGEFCTQQQLPVWEDGMNQSLAYRRNRIRLGVLPYLKTHFNPQVETTLAHTAEILQAEVAFLEREAQRLLVESVPHQPPTLSPAHSPTCLGYIHRQKLKSAPTAIQRRALRQFLQNTLSLSANFQQVEKVLALVTAPNSSRTDPLTKTWVAAVIDPWIVICPASLT